MTRNTSSHSLQKKVPSSRLFSLSRHQNKDSRRANAENGVTVYIAAVVVSGVLVAPLFVYRLINQPPAFYFPYWEVRIEDIGWNIPLARAEFNLTFTSGDYTSETTLDHVEVNGTKVDSYPNTPSLKHGESTALRVYYPYGYDTAYEFGFVHVTGENYRIVLASPSDIGSARASQTFCSIVSFSVR